MGVLLFGILLDISLFIHSRVIYQVTFKSMHFQFVILKIQKKIGILHCLAFLSFEYSSLA
jgi:hypothetical protein